MLEIIVYTLVFVVMILMAIIGMSIKDIRWRLQSMTYKKKGFGLVGVVGNDYKMRYYWKKIKDIVNIGGQKFVLKPQFMVRQRGIPTYYFYEGDCRPIDMMKRKRDDRLISPDLLDTMIIKAKAAGSVVKDKKKDMMFYVMLAAAIGGMGALVLCFQMFSQWDSLIQLIPKCV